MNKLRWICGFRYELSADGKGLLKYFKQNSFYHVHSDEMTSMEGWKYRSLTTNKGKVRFSI